ncbi:MAG: phosphoribosylanthranilate isomerase [Cyclobacteriaceae bacterium]|nr:phosphoribosylanthranilate isomerase [Cyclobacteriaceae bacterium]UYN85664.1 MAG: phosphoribosylanthranilate isomerase [Cyclobacteriaceae bacterium]
MKLKLKVCGMKYAENIQQIASLLPDYMGFIFYEPSPRFVGEDFVLPSNFPIQINKVGVFVDQPEEYIISKIKRYGLSHVQLHGNESPVLCESLRKQVKIIKVVSIGTEFDFNLLKPFADVVDYFLFDTKGLQPGGNGVAFDWKILTGYNYDIPFFLSGGLDMENISRLSGLNFKSLYGLDINSRVEIHPGLKDKDKVREFITHLQTTNNQQPTTI